MIHARHTEAVWKVYSRTQHCWTHHTNTGGPLPAWEVWQANDLCWSVHNAKDITHPYILDTVSVTVCYLTVNANNFRGTWKTTAVVCCVLRENPTEWKWYHPGTITEIWKDLLTPREGATSTHADLCDWLDVIRMIQSQYAPPLPWLFPKSS